MIDKLEFLSGFIWGTFTNRAHFWETVTHPILSWRARKVLAKWLAIEPDNIIKPNI